MIFNRHSNLEGKHAILSASKPHWLNYTDERMFEYVDNLQAAAIGTRKHAVAAELIRLGIKLRETSQTLNMYVNDAIGFNMTPEQVLFYSEWAFGTADTISFSNRLLRIHDLKTGVNKVSDRQLKIYAALFCLEYKVRPSEIEFELRIYQNDEIILCETDPLEIVYIMDRMKEVNDLVTKMMKEVL